MADQVTSPTRLPPLLRLPNELKLHIFSYFSEAEDFEPTLIILRRTHRAFRDIIPPIPYGPPRRGDLACTKSREQKLLVAENRANRHLYLIPPNMFPCYWCLLVLDSSAFGTPPRLAANRHLFQGLLYLPLGSPQAWARTCKRCWDEPGP